MKKIESGRRRLFLFACNLIFVVSAVRMTALTAFAAEETKLEEITAPIIGLLKNVLNVLIPVVAAAGAIFCVFLGIHYAKAEEPQEREKAKAHLKNAIIGFFLIFILIVVLDIGTGVMVDWMNDNVQNM